MVQSLPEYAELYCLTNFSFLHGASHAEELVARTAHGSAPWRCTSVPSTGVSASEAGALVLLVAADDVPAAGRRRAVLLALQVAVDAVQRDGQPTAVLEA